MLLETLDTKKNDIIIFSENDYNIDKNFKIIFKADEENIAHRITFKEVCKNITSYAPKNLIMYRLLTNIQSLQLNSSIFGIFIYLNGNLELFYTDPVYALKELEFFIQQYNPQNLRFIIQQVGLSTASKIDNFSNFSELYHFDLKAEESMATNDKEFVEAIILSQAARGKKEKRKTNGLPAKENRMQIIEPASVLKFDKKQSFYKIDDAENSFISKVKQRTDEKISVVAEEKPADYKDINKIKVSETLINQVEKESKKETVKANSKFTTTDGLKLKSNSVLDIFKSSDSLKDYMEKKGGKNILKIK